jgi:septal ring factor EnvC (AmiA/AmiB activator)
MLTSDEHSGLFTLMLGLIVVVFAGIGLSMAVDRRFSFSTSVSALEADVKRNESEIEYMREIHSDRTKELTGHEPKRKMADASLAAIQMRVTELERRRKTLIAERESLRASIPVLEQEFVRYRVKYRENTRDAAVGEFLGKLIISGGREYQEAYISRVTDVGLEIRHAHGTARISATDLNPQFQSRFQWDDEERRARLGEKLTVCKTLERIPGTPKRLDAPRAGRDEVFPDSEKIQMLRGKVMAWRTKVSQLRSERNRALSSAYGSQASPRGSLETWQGRAARLGGEIARAEAELAAAKAALAVVAPDDALLRPHMDNR